MVEMQLSSVVFPEPEAPHDTDVLAFLHMKADLVKRLGDNPLTAVVFIHVVYLK